MVRHFLTFKKRYPTFSQYDSHFTFAIKCDEDKPGKTMIDCCQPILEQEILNSAHPDKPIMIFALGPSVLKSLGLKVGRYSSVRGKFMKCRVRDREAYVYPSFTKRELIAKTGFYDVLYQHIHRFMNVVRDVALGLQVQTETRVEDLITNYEFPSTLAEVSDLVDRIVSFTKRDQDPVKFSLSIDTETNTVNPHRGKLKILTLVAAWDHGCATSIPMEHPETPWTLEEVRPYIAKLLQCDKPKLMHNAKFDYKVLTRKGFGIANLAWDTMLGEHLLSEDKKGNYGLKSLVGIHLPEYANYDDDLQKVHDKMKEGQKNPASGLKGAAKKLAEDDGYISVPLKVLNIYGAIDADVTRQIAYLEQQRMSHENIRLHKRRAQLARNRSFQKAAKPGTTEPRPLQKLMKTRCIPMTRILGDMELYGMAVDREYLSDLSSEMDKSIIQYHNELEEMVKYSRGDEKFNPNSNLQIQRILFSNGYLHPETREAVSYQHIIPENEIPKTPTGQMSMNANFLKLLRNTHNCAFSSTLLQYRALTKARNTFLSNIEALSHETGRMHTSFHIAGTATGRLSSSDENMQNIPMFIGSHNIKKVFIPTPGEDLVIVNADAKAAEVRIYAAYSGDRNLINALNDGMDPHSYFASVVYNPASVLEGIRDGEQRRIAMATIGIDEAHAWSYADFQNRDNFTGPDKAYGKQLDKLRKNIKRVVFGILYGAGRGNIANIVGISKDQAKAIIDVLFKMFPTIPKYIDLTKHQVRNLCTVETFLGRRRRFPEQLNMTPFQKSRAERQAVNFKIQSTSSDIVMGVMTEVDGPLRDLDSRLLITVHDSLVAEVPRKYVSQIPDMINHYGVKEVARQYPWLPVPFQWDVEAGPSYGELSSVDKFLKQQPQYSIQADHEELDIRSSFKALGE